MSHYDEKQKRTLIVYAAIFLLLTMGIIVVGVISYRNYEQDFRRQAENQISAIAELKMNGLVNWRKERLVDAELLHHNVAFSTLVERYFENSGDEDAQNKLIEWLDHYQAYDQYDRIRLLDVTGAERFSFPSTPDPLDSHVAQDVIVSLKSREVTFVDFHRDESTGGEIHLAILVPIFTGQQDVRPLGALYISLDPDTYLYPFLNQWPIPSKTSETLLVRRDGEDAQYLNELRFKKNVALTLRFPLTNTNIPAVKAALGQTGIVEGKDYRGESVLADVRAVPDSPWFLVSKMDTAEVFAPLAIRLWQTIIMIGMAIFAVGTALLTVWRQQRLLYYRSQVEAATALRESEEKFRKAFMISPDSININRLHDGMFVSINNGFTRIMGYTANEAVGRSSLDLNIWVDPKDREALVEGLKKHGEVNNLEGSFCAKNGNVKYGLMSASILDLNGTPHIISITRDITERKQAEDALRESEQRYKMVSELASDYIYKIGIAADGQTSLDFLTDSFYTKTGISREDHQTIETWMNIFHPDDRIKVMEFLQALIIALGAGELECRSNIAGDQSRWIKIIARTEWDEQKKRVFAIVGAVKDITERKQAEDKIRQLNTELEQRVQSRTSDLQAANKELEAFSYSVSHDLRAPLRGIDGWSQALLEDYAEKLDEQGRQYIDRVRTEAQRMGYLIDDMLQLSRLTRAEMVKENVDLSALAQTIVERLKKDETNRQADFIIETGLTAKGDSYLLEAVLANLLGNAFKFTGKRAIARIEFGQTESQGQCVFFIRDNGAGFDMAYSQKLFGAFQRMHKTSEFSGSGIGLASVQRIIHRHGGQVWAEAEVDRGATFYFTLGQNRE